MKLGGNAAVKSSQVSANQQRKSCVNSPGKARAEVMFEDSVVSMNLRIGKDDGVDSFRELEVGPTHGGLQSNACRAERLDEGMPGWC